MELTITQKKVLKVLYENKDKFLTPQQINRLSGINNIRHVEQALKKFMENDYVYQPTIKGEFTVSPDGISAGSDQFKRGNEC